MMWARFRHICSYKFQPSIINRLLITHDIFIVCRRSFGGSCFNCRRSRHRASECPNKKDF
ncbi:hypothetical protein NC652_035673 [Populus alba x Populus x berolinensis]|nr:hypothetical protein NC652_035673 [Populus alba x Populus x berolinensis]